MSYILNLLICVGMILLELRTQLLNHVLHIKILICVASIMNSVNLRVVFRNLLLSRKTHMHSTLKSCLKY
jgi:hypothetical protein